MTAFTDDPSGPLVGLFIGSGLSFSDTALRLASQELPSMTFRRLDNLRDLIDSAAHDPANVRLVIVDEALLGQLLEALPLIREKYGSSRPVLAYRDQSIALRLIKDIAQIPGGEKIGFLPMKIELDCWLLTLRLLAWGERYIPADLFGVSHLPFSPPDEAPSDPDAPVVNLTARECQVLSAAAEGKQNKIIADDFGLSQHTVKLHMHHVIVKLGVSNRTEATLWYLAQKPRPTGHKP